jgi:hypothetical protein
MVRFEMDALLKEARSMLVFVHRVGYRRVRAQ